jgi:concanavalin A-like lectin/glucanase superfamily protein
MKLAAILLALAPVAIGVPVLAITHASAATTPTVVARYTFDSGATATGRIAEKSGRGVALRIRTADNGAVRFYPTANSTGKYIRMPLRCAAGATTCPRALLEGADDADLDPGTRTFRWGATVYQSRSQLAGSSNVMQKGVYTTESQWKMQIGEDQGKAQCVVVGQGSGAAYLVRSSVTVADSKWHKILCLRNAGLLAVYVDGVNRGYVRIPTNLSIENNKPLRVGGPNFNTNSDMYHGFLDDVYASVG